MLIEMFSLRKGYLTRNSWNEIPHIGGERYWILTFDVLPNECCHSHWDELPTGWKILKKEWTKYAGTEPIAMKLVLYWEKARRECPKVNYG